LYGGDSSERFFSKSGLTLYLHTGCIFYAEGNEMQGLTIGEVAKRAAVHIETLRY
jgi:hypothetical protein